MTRHLLDTCAFLDLLAGRWTRPEAREALRGSPEAGLLCVSVWEMARKLRLGKLKLPCDQRGFLAFVRAACDRHGLLLLPLTAEICHEAELLPAHHADPFDRMIIAAAHLTSATVFTIDPGFARYPVRIISPR